MCGIAGFAGAGALGDLERMIQSIAYRGPDYIGTYLGEGVGLAHARLSILDLSPEANQPFFSEDNRLAIVFNGEIYNFPVLKGALAKTGKYRFRTSSDTEVLLYLYQEHGSAMLSMLNGMFAFAIWDFDKKEMFLARDRMGKKPLYFTEQGGDFIFGSELKAVVNHPACPREIDLDALNQYLTFEYVPTPASIYKGVRKLEPGHYLIWREGKVQTNACFYKIDFRHTESDIHQAGKTLDDLLDDATRIRMISDVPLGVFLSGGLDSSLIAYYAQKNASNKVKTFSIGFSEKSYDESDYALAVSKQLGTEHHSRILTAKDTLDLVGSIYQKLDEPFADASLIPTHLLSCFTREHVTVALGGDGSDELLAGYPTFQSAKVAPFFGGMPRPLLSLMGKMAKVMPVSDKNISFDFKVKQFLRGFERDKKHMSTLWLGAFLPSEKHSLFSADSRQSLGGSDGLEIIDRWLAELPAESTAFNKALYIYYKTYLLDDILTKVDRASMYTSLEVRAPFLDYRIVDYVSGLPAHFKLKGMTTKYLLKRVARGKIPDMVIDRPKKGFGIPMSSWLRNDLRDLCEDLLSKPSLDAHGLFDAGFVRRILDEHFALKANHRKQIWTLMVFQMWWRNMHSK